MTQTCYRKLTRYKYQLMQDYHQNLDIQGFAVSTPFILLTTNGTLTIKNRYAWDGPSGPTIDTQNFIRGSLVHDVLYQLMRMQLLPFSCRDYSDRLLHDMCVEDGMSRFRAWYVYKGLKYFGSGNAKPGTQKPDGVYYAP